MALPEFDGFILVSRLSFPDDFFMVEGGKPRISLSMAITLAIVVLGLWLISYPLMFRHKRHRGQTEAVSNARQIGLALFEFEKEYGRYPDEITAEALRQRQGNQWNLGTASSNDYFRQLIAAGVVYSPIIFYAKTQFSKKPEPRIEPHDNPLAAGEVGFGYLMDGKSALDIDGNPSRPLVCTPLAIDSKTVSNQIFDRSIDDGKAVVLRIDNSVQSLPIDPRTNRASLGGGKHLLQTGPDTVWGTDAKPVIIPPLPKP